jgi:hypothetical protein
VRNGVTKALPLLKSKLDHREKSISIDLNGRELVRAEPALRHETVPGPDIKSGRLHEVVGSMPPGRQQFIELPEPVTLLIVTERETLGPGMEDPP